MASIYCASCAATMSDQAHACPQCGHPNAAKAHSLNGKSRTTAAILAILIGGIGAHKFYLNKAGMGVLYIVFCWTFVPAIVALVEGIIYLTQSDAEFAKAQGLK